MVADKDNEDTAVITKAKFLNRQAKNGNHKTLSELK